MSTQATHATSTVVYPDSDGKPMADNTKQWRWIARYKGNLDVLFAERDDVFVAGDLLWYPVQGQPSIRVAPDVLVVFGRPKGDRGSYKQFEEDNLPPQVVFEVLSPGNTIAGMVSKHFFTNAMGWKSTTCTTRIAMRSMAGCDPPDSSIKWEPWTAL